LLRLASVDSDMNLPYVVPRVVRHFLPEPVSRFLLLRSLVIKPGLETSDPAGAVARYVDVLASRQMSLAGKRVLVFGYGGRFDIGVGLLSAGAADVVLCDPYAAPDDDHNRHLAQQYPEFVELVRGRAQPAPGRMTVLQADVREAEVAARTRKVDLVISNSVYEHLGDAAGTTEALRGLTLPGGLHIHFVDLRDHFFKYPFQMLVYSERIWRTWLNPSSNHNRLRVWDYRRIFEASFAEVEIEILQRDQVSYEKIRTKVRPEFASGEITQDCVTLIRIVAASPRG
jgi:hypothetical protein